MQLIITELKLELHTITNLCMHHNGRRLSNRLLPLKLTTCKMRLFSLKTIRIKSVIPFQAMLKSAFLKRKHLKIRILFTRFHKIRKCAFNSTVKKLRTTMLETNWKKNLKQEVTQCILEDAWRMDITINTTILKRKRWEYISLHGLNIFKEIKLLQTHLWFDI